MKKITHVLIIIVCLFSPTLFADSKNNDGLAGAYVAGFLAGAQLTDNVIIKRLDTYNENKEPSDFFKRAFKTRLGIRPAKVPATYYAGYCLPEDTSEKIVITAVLNEIESADSSNHLDRASTVYLALRNLYPCEE